MGIRWRMRVSGINGERKWARERERAYLHVAVAGSVFKQSSRPITYNLF